MAQRMRLLRSFFGAAVIDEKLYAVGGAYGDNSVEKMNPSTGEWSFVAPMKTGRWDHCVVALNEKLYAIGGYNEKDDQYLRSVEVYDPTRDEWSESIPISIARNGAHAFVHGGEIFVAGGKTTGDKFVVSMEVFNLATNEWTPLPTTANLPFARADGGWATIDLPSKLDIF